MDNAQMLEKFQTVNREKVERLASLFPASQRAFLELLPLLFHINSSGVPGYIDSEIPTGIVHYQPSQAAIHAVRKYQPAYNYFHSSLPSYPIRALYLIKKTGFYHYDNDELLELWLIHIESLTAEQRTLLAQKASAIVDWAKSQGIALAIKLFDDKQISSPSPTIATFDLDVFYCCSLVIAGSIPKWWLDNATENSSLPLHQINSAIAFFPLTTPSATDLFDFAADRISLAMEQQFDPCLDLIYTEMLLAAYPDCNWLSDSVKSSVASAKGNSDPLQLDPNSLKLTLIQQVITDPSKLKLAQQSLYRNSHEALSIATKQARYPWRRAFMEKLVNIWQWDQQQISRLDSYLQRNYRQSLTLSQLVQQQIADTLGQLFSFADQQQLASTARLQQLQQKFDRLFTEQQDCLKRLPTPFLPKNVAEQLHLYQTNHNDWALSDQPEQFTKTPFYQHQSLLNVLAWATNNQLLSLSTRLKVTNKTHTMQINVVLSLVQYLLKSPLLAKPEQFDKQALTNDSTIDQLMVFANIEGLANNSISQHALQVSSLQSDPLNYGNDKRSLIANIEMLIQPNNEHWQYFNFSGNDSVLQMLGKLFHWSPKALADTKLLFWSYYPNQNLKINSRLEKLVMDARSHYQKTPENGEYILAINGQIRQLHWQQSLCDIASLPKNKSLRHHLSQKHDPLCITAIDDTLDKNGLYSLLLQHQSEQLINLFLHHQQNTIVLYVIDNMGALFTQTCHDLKPETLLNHFHTFLAKIVNNTLAFFQIYQHSSGFNVKKVAVKLVTAKANYLPVVVEMDSAKEDTQCKIQCGKSVFTGKANQSALFSQVRALILSLRKSKNNYPLYISQLTFKQADASVQQHLLQKQRLEYLLNKLAN